MVAIGLSRSWLSCSGAEKAARNWVSFMTKWALIKIHARFFFQFFVEQCY